MEQYEKKMKRAFFLFHSMFSLSICLITFSIISTSLEHNYTELSQNHIRHLQKNFNQKLSLCSQNLTFFAEDALIFSCLQNENEDLLSEKLQNFQKSTKDIASFAVYRYENGKLVFFTGTRKALPIEDFFETSQNPKNMCGWYFFPNEENPFLYLCPVQTETSFAGYLLFRINADSFLSSFIGTNTSCLWEEHIAIVSDQILWCDDENYWKNADTDVFTRNTNFLKTSKYILSSETITENGEHFVELLEKRTYELYYPLLLALAAVFLCSLSFFYFTVSRRIHKITSRLQRLQAKMTSLKK